MKGFIIKCSRWGERICRKGVPGQGHTVLIEATWWRGGYWNCSGNREWAFLIINQKNTRGNPIQRIW